MRRSSLLIVIVALLLGAVLLGRESGVIERRGDALWVVNETGFGLGRVPPGSEVVMLYMFLHNVSDQPVIVESVEPISESEPPGVIEVVRTLLAPSARTGDAPQGALCDVPSIGGDNRWGMCVG